jgi:hypothetical protein
MSRFTFPAWHIRRKRGQLCGQSLRERRSGFAALAIRSIELRAANIQAFVRVRPALSSGINASERSAM